jgi:hypothetical protein
MSLTNSYREEMKTKNEIYERITNRLNLSLLVKGCHICSSLIFHGFNIKLKTSLLFPNLLLLKICLPKYKKLVLKLNLGS